MGQGLLVFAKNLDGNLRIDARYEFVVAGLDDLRKVELDAGKSFHTAAHGIDQFVFRLCRRPLAFRFQADVHFVVADAFRVAAQFGASDLGDDGFDFGKLAQRLLNL